MANVSITNTFTANTTAVASEVNQNFTDLVDYINDRDNGSADWQNVTVTATVANPLKVSGDQATTEVSINNTATDGDPLISFELGGVATFQCGIDDSDSDYFKFGTSTITNSTAFQVPSGGSKVEFPTGSESAPSITHIGDTNTGIYFGTDQVGISLGGDTKMLLASPNITLDTMNLHVDTFGTQDVELEVSDGSTTGGGTIHRAASGTHSSIKVKDLVKRFSKADRLQAYDDVKSLQHVSFKYKKGNKVTGELSPNPEGVTRKGLIYEEVPESIRGTGEAIMIDDRIANLEMALIELIDKVEKL